MITLCVELAKIIKQLYGCENIFGYKTTEANQLFVFYCFFGKMYFTNKVNPRVKYFWYFLNFVEVIYFCVMGTWYFWYDEANTDFMLKMTVANAICANYVEIFGFPLISYLYGTGVDTMIELVDELLTTGISFKTNGGSQKMRAVEKDRVFAIMLGPMVICFMVIYSFISFIDLTLFFDEAKVKNHLYYGYPTATSSMYSSQGYYFFTNSLSTFMLEIYMFQLISSLAMVLLWNTVCCYELACLRDYFTTIGRQLDDHIEKGSTTWGNWNPDYQAGMLLGVRRFQKITTLINSLRGYVELMGTFVVPTAFFYSVAMLYFSTAQGLPFGLRMKFIVCCFGDSFLAYFFYRIAQNLDDMIHQVSLAIYSTPWYWSVVTRKNVYVFLCQTHSVKNFAIIKVYELLLKNFSRFFNAVMTSTNLLRKLTLKIRIFKALSNYF